MKILLTGATGLLGREVVNQLLSQGHEVSAVTRNRASGLDERVAIIELDLASDWDPCDLDFNFEGVIHLAQSREFRNFPGKSRDVFQVNINSTHKLLELARVNNCKSFVYASSGGVYANKPGVITEASPLRPVNDLGFYLGSKLCAEVLCHSYSEFFPIAVLRPFFIYGPHQDRSMLMPRLIDSLANGGEIRLDAPDGMIFNPVHVIDAASVVVSAIEIKSSETINVAGPERITIGELIRVAANLLDKVPIVIRTDKAAQNFHTDSSRMKQILNRRTIGPFERLADLFV